MRLKSLTLPLVSILLTLSLSAQQQTASPPSLSPSPAKPSPYVWDQTSLSVGFQTVSGDSDSTSLSLYADWSQQFVRVENDLMANASFSRSGGSTIYQSENVDWTIRGRAADPAKQRRWFPMAHLSFEHHETSGIDFRGTAVVGAGSHLIETSKARLTIEGGVGGTDEKQKEDASFATVYLAPSLRWNLSKSVVLKNKTNLNINATEGGDIRMHSETDLNFQLTSRVSLQNTFLASYDQQPVRGHKRTNLRTSISVSFSLYKGSPPRS